MHAGADAISDKNLLVTSDFVNPVTTVTAQVFSLPVATLLNQTAEVHDLVSSESAIVTRNTVRVWDLSDLSSIKNTIILPGAQGVIDIKVGRGGGPGGVGGLGGYQVHVCSRGLGWQHVVGQPVQWKPVLCSLQWVSVVACRSQCVGQCLVGNTHTACSQWWYW
jgi:hypothetical protein